MSSSIKSAKDLQARWNQALKSHVEGESPNKVSANELMDIGAGISVEWQTAFDKLTEAQEAGAPANQIATLQAEVNALQGPTHQLAVQLLATMDEALALDQFEPNLELKTGLALNYGSDELKGKHRDFVSRGLAAADTGYDGFCTFLEDKSTANAQDRAELSALLMGLLGKPNKTLNGFSDSKYKQAAQELVDMGVPVTQGAARLLKDFGITGDIAIRPFTDNSITGAEDIEPVDAASTGSASELTPYEKSVVDALIKVNGSGPAVSSGKVIATLLDPVINETLKLGNFEAGKAARPFYGNLTAAQKDATFVLQDVLVALGIYGPNSTLAGQKGRRDGLFGPVTAKGVADLQEKLGLEATGEFDIPTAEALKALLTGTSLQKTDEVDDAPSSNIDDNDPPSLDAAPEPVKTEAPATENIPGIEGENGPATVAPGTADGTVKLSSEVVGPWSSAAKAAPGFVEQMSQEMAAAQAQARAAAPATPGPAANTSNTEVPKPADSVVVGPYQQQRMGGTYENKK